MPRSEGQLGLDLPNFDPGEVRRTSILLSRTSRGAKREVRKFGAEHLPVGTGKIFGHELRTPLLAPKRPRRKEVRNLLQERDRLQNEIEEWEADLLAAGMAEAPYVLEVKRAKNRLYSLYQNQSGGDRIGSKADVFAAHDAYVACRHAWWPFGEPVQKCTRVLKELRRELKIVNAEIGI